MENTALTTDQIRSEIEQLDEEFTNTYNRGDARDLASFYSEAAMVLPPNHDMVEGRQQIEAFWQALMNMGASKIQLQVVEAEQHGETAIEVGRATIMGEGDQLLDEGKYVVIWKRENGAWKIYRDIFNSNRQAQG